MMKPEIRPGQRPVNVLLYTRVGCHLCDDAKKVLEKHQRGFSLEISEIDIDGSPELQTRYGESVPVIVIQGRERFRGVINESLLVRTLKATW